MERYTKLPFCGFCNSIYDSGFDSEIESDIENLIEEYGAEYADWITDNYWRHVDCSDARSQICERHVETFNDTFMEETGIDLGLRFESMTSPREYNFETDRLFAYFDESAMVAVFKLAEPRLAKVVKERFTSRSGFISFYSSAVDDWTDKPLADYDHNELETVILAALDDPETFGRDVEDSVHEYAAGNGGFACLNWQEFEAALEAERDTRISA